MGEELSPEAILFNDRLNPRAVLHRMGFGDEAISEEGETLRLFCPIHKDQVRRSLILEKHRNRFVCQYKSCPAHSGGLLVELLALYWNVPVAEAIRQYTEESHPERQLVAQADRLIAESKLTEAAALLQEALRLAPRDEITRCKLAALYLEMGQRDRGFKEYLTAAEDFACKNQVDKTLSIYNILVMLSPQDLRVRRQMAYLFSRLGRHKEAAEHLKWVIDQLMERGEIEEAIKDSREVLQLCPNEPDVHMLLARLLSQTHRINEAVGEALQAAELALERGDRTTVETAVTFGLIYNPLHERLRELQALLHDSPLAAEPSTGESMAGEDEFGEWLESLQEEVEGGKVSGIRRQSPSPAAGTSTIRQEQWLLYCRNTLAKLDNEKLESMGRQLRAMFEDVEASFKAGTLSEWELNILKDFYASFCLAYDQVRKSKL
ncbi:MAG: hypothetical protein N3D11_13075 [Candidatus Sumerlaeia bacterium]|nr:hypothetical protein [Candidatus Sumerlaeia bacterium]